MKDVWGCVLLVMVVVFILLIGGAFGFNRGIDEGRDSILRELSESDIHIEHVKPEGTPYWRVVEAP